MKDYRPRLTKGKLKSHLHLTKPESRVLVIGDTHEPFSLDGYLDFCVETYYNYNCNRVVHIGDVADHHYSSYHETDADGMGGADELELTIKKLKRWKKAFPKVDAILGNHDLIIMRKAQTSNLPSRWLREYSEVLELPGWTFHHELEIDDVRYIHGTGAQAMTKAKNDMQSTVQGDKHTLAYVKWFVGNRNKVFGMQTGCGIDKTKYAMAYGKWHPKPAIGCAVIIGGHTPINIMMNL